MQAFLDHWDNNVCTQEHTVLENDAEIPKLIHQLDGAHHTLLSLVLDQAGNVLQIAGGPEEFVVTGEQNGVIHNLTNPDSTDTATVAVVAGGNTGHFPPMYIIAKSQAIKCALAYFHAKAIPAADPRFAWEIIESTHGDNALNEEHTAI